MYHRFVWHEVFLLSFGQKLEPNLTPEIECNLPSISGRGSTSYTVRNSLEKGSCGPQHPTLPATAEWKRRPRNRNLGSLYCLFFFLPAHWVSSNHLGQAARLSITWSQDRPAISIFSSSCLPFLPGHTAGSHRHLSWGQVIPLGLLVLDKRLLSFKVETLDYVEGCTKVKVQGSAFSVLV